MAWQSMWNRLSAAVYGHLHRYTRHFVPVGSVAIVVADDVCLFALIDGELVRAVVVSVHLSTVTVGCAVAAGIEFANLDMSVFLRSGDKASFDVDNVVRFVDY